MAHAVAFLAKTLFAERAIERLRVIVDPEMIFKVAHLLEHLFAFVHAAHEELTSSNSCVIRRLNVEVLRK